MAEYKKGNRILTEEENTEEILSIYAGILFVIGAAITFVFMNDLVPQEWSKEGRFLIIFPSAVGAGLLLSMLNVQAYLGSLYLAFIAFWGLLGSFVWWLL